MTSLGTFSSAPMRSLISLNLKRRHLNASQRAMIAAKLATLQQGARTDLSPIGERSQATAAKALNVGKRSVERAKIVRDQGGPELIKAVEAGEVSVSAAVNSIRPRSPRLRSKAPSPAGEALELTRNDVFEWLARHNLFGWLSTAPVEARQHVLDAWGSRKTAKSIPPSWNMMLVPARSNLSEVVRLNRRIANLKDELHGKEVLLEKMQRKLRKLGPVFGAPDDGNEDGVDVPGDLQRTPAGTTPVVNGDAAGHHGEVTQNGGTVALR
jgi:hypothetical protein